MFWAVFMHVLVSASWVSLRMFCLCFSYRCVDSVFCCIVLCLGSGLWKIVYVGRWSDIGGESVPAVICVSVSVVRTTSMRDAVLW